MMFNVNVIKAELAETLCLRISEAKNLSNQADRADKHICIFQIIDCDDSDISVSVLISI